MTTSGGIGAGGSSTPDVRALLLQLSLSNARALTSGLNEGDVLTARVGQSFADGSVMLEVGGITMVASSAIPLTADALVRLQVQIAGNQPVLKLLDALPVDMISTSTAALRATHLGLPSTPLAILVQQAFEAVGAPLTAERLQTAMSAVKDVPSSEAPIRAQAMGLLAKINAPVTAPLVALAERSLRGNQNATIPNVAAGLQQVQQAIQSALTASRLPTGIHAETPAVSLIPPSIAAPQRDSAPIINTPGQATGARKISVPLANMVNMASAPAVNNPVSQLPVSPTSPALLATATSQSVPHSNIVAAPSSPMTTAPPTASAIAMSQTKTRLSPRESTVPEQISSTPPPATPTPKPAGNSFVSTATTSLLRQPLVVGSSLNGSSFSLQLLASILAEAEPPDGGREGVPAIMKALSHVGILPRDETKAGVVPREQTAMQQLAQAVTASPQEPSDTRAPLVQQTVDQALTVMVREQLAETMFKPQALADYDKVIAVPMFVQQQPTPTRFAIAERKTAAGTATFVRVDTELTSLGPISVRMSGIDGGAVSITIFARGPAQVNLTEALPALSDSLRTLGVTAGIRIADWSDSNA